MPMREKESLFLIRTSNDRRSVCERRAVSNSIFLNSGREVFHVYYNYVRRSVRVGVKKGAARLRGIGVLLSCLVRKFIYSWELLHSIGSVISRTNINHSVKNKSTPSFIQMQF